MGKDKKEKKAAKAQEDLNGEEAPVAGMSYEEKKKFVSIIAKPLAEEKLAKKVLKLAKKAAKRKQLKRGVKEVVKALRKNVKGLCILAGDISPIDVITHIPVVCEDHDVPYVFVPSKEELGAAALSKRPTSVMLLLPAAQKNTPAEGAEEFDEAYRDIDKRLRALQVVK